VLDACALVVWNIGTRSPITALRDVVAASRNSRVFVAGALAFLAGLTFAAAGTVMLVPAVGDVGSDFVPVEIFAFIVALAIELLIGNDVRMAAARLSGSSRAR
jgi:hypothetical protein